MHSASPEQFVPFLFILPLIFFVFFIAISALMVFVWCRIFSKAGYHWAMGLLIMVPIANIVVPFILAFGQWPLHREIEELRNER